MQPSTTPPHLYVVETGETVVVALVRPEFPGAAGETAIERAIGRLTPAPYQAPARWGEARQSTMAPIAPGMAGVIARTVGLASLALLALIVFSIRWSAVPGFLAAIAIGLTALYRYGRLQKAVDDRWRAAHRVLAGPDKV